MDIKQAAAELREKLGRPAWLVSVGVGEVEGREALFLYVTSANHPPLEYLKDGWNGYPVVIRKFGAIAPLKAT